MKNSSKTQIQTEYQQLKNKVEDQIKLLESKLAKNTQIHYHKNIVSNKNLQVPAKNQYHIKSTHQISDRSICKHQCNHNNHQHSCVRHSPCHHHSHCSRSNSIHLQQSSQNNVTNIIPLTNKNTRYTQISKNQQKEVIIQRNQILQQAFIKSIENQKELAENLKLLSQKIQKLQTNSRVKSNSQEFSSDNLFHFKSSGSKDNDSSSGHIVRAKSLVSQQFNPILREKVKIENIMTESDRSKSSRKKNLKHSKSKSKSKSKTKSSLKSNSQYLFQGKSKNKGKGPSLQGLKSKKNKDSNFNQNWKAQYFGNSVCPVHSNPKIFAFKSAQKQVYKDTYHRNRKHQRDHLIESFKQQQIARKKLMAKILQSEGLQLKGI